jgi:cytochrome P450 family 6
VFFIGFRPVLVLRDPDLIKTILVKDFNTFYERNVHSNHKTDPLSQNLFLLKGPAWRRLRVKISPIFTSFRLKQMFPMVSACAENLTKYIDLYSTKGKPLEVKEVSAKYATDVISTGAFGIQSNCLMDPNAEFREFGRKVFAFSAYRSFELMATFMLPFVVKVMDLKFFSSDTTKFLKRVFWDTIREREEKNILREDILQLLIQLKNEDVKENGVAQHNGISNGAAQEDMLGKLTRSVLCG